MADLDKSRANVRGLAIAYLVVILDAIGFAILIPVLPFVMLRFGAGPAMVTQLVAVYGFAGFFGSPVIGFLSDRIGRLRVVQLTLLASAIAYAGMIISWSLAGVLIFRAITGAFVGREAVLRALVTDDAPAEKHAQILGNLTAAAALGSTLGPLLGSVPAWLLGAGDHHAVLLGTIVLLNVVAFVGASLVFGRAHAVGATVIDAGPASRADRHHALKKLAKPLVVQVLLSYAWGVVLSTTALLVHTKFGWAEKETGLLLGLAAVAIVAARMFLMPRLNKWLGLSGASAATSIISAIALVGVALARAPWLFLLAYSTLVLALNVANMAPTVMITMAVPRAERGFALGIRQSISAVATFGGASVNGLLFQFVAPSAPGLAAAVAALGAAIALGVFGKRASQTAAATKAA
ncbi:MFS transporter [Caulobacter sp. KR2-114]|uniref:MFS transporter n=1 Tax=Caulobacter sp. KR2-114 TaxID=3400912 RepID=UPI003C0B1AC1